MTEMQSIRATGAKGMRLRDFFDSKQLKFLYTETKPEEGCSCEGTEIQSNGLQKENKKIVFQEVKEISSQKYAAITEQCIPYLVDVI